MTSNYNQLFVSQSVYDKYEVGQYMTIPALTYDWRLRKFDGLKIESKGYTMGSPTFTFNWDDWHNNNPHPNNHPSAL